MKKYFEPHSEKQDVALFSQKKFTVVCTGIQWGKTRVGAHRMMHAMMTHPHDNFLVCAPTYKILNQSTLPAFKEIAHSIGTYNKVDAEFKLHTGGIGYFRTGTDPDSIVGITNVRHIWLDEGGKFSLYFWENATARASFMRCPITITTTPYALNWLYRDIFKPFKQGKRHDEVELIQATSKENPYFPQDEYDKRELTMDPRRFRMLYGGSFEQMEGLVYDCWKDSENYCPVISLPAGTVYKAGVDWGFNHPFAISIRAITPDGIHYGISEFYKTGLSISDQVRIAKQKKDLFNIETFYCDPSRPDMILEFNRHGLTAIGARNDIKAGINLHYELIKSRRYREFYGKCPHSQDERETYHYPEAKDQTADKSEKEMVPVDQNNHLMDAQRYITMMTMYGEKTIPKTPDPTKVKKNIYGFTKISDLGKGEKGWTEKVS